MGKHDFMSPKAIGNRIKSKGLQKLRWYCQMCQKQCRDENGFKCHLTSETHQRQIMMFGADQQRFISGFSEEFESAFLEHLRRAHPHSRVAATVVYNEYIAHKQHIHMNATQWHTLTEFVQYLGKTGKCRIDNTPKGWFMSIIQQDPQKRLEEERRAKRERKEYEDESVTQKVISEQIERAKKQRGAGSPEPTPSATPMLRDEAGEAIAFSLDAGKKRAAAAAEEQRAHLLAGNVFKRASGAAPPAETSAPAAKAAPPATKRIADLMRRELNSKRKEGSDARAVPASSAAQGGGKMRAWLREGIVVKIMSPKLKEHGLYKRKAEVTQVLDSFVGELRVLDTADVVRVDQEELETVIPQPGGQVLVLKGTHRGRKAELMKIDEKRFQAKVRLGEDGGDELWLEYDEISKLPRT